MVLWESTVNFQSSTPQGRRRPTVVVMPRPDTTSNRGWGRSADVNPDDQAIVPYTTAMHILMGLTFVREIETPYWETALRAA